MLDLFFGISAAFLEKFPLPVRRTACRAGKGECGALRSAPLRNLKLLFRPEGAVGRKVDAHI